MVHDRAKPAFPRLQHGHPLARGLVLGMPFTEGAGVPAGFVGMHKRSAFSFSGDSSQASWEPGAHGRRLGLNQGPTTSDDVLVEGPSIDQTTEISVVAWFTAARFGQIDSPSNRGLVSKYQGDSNNRSWVLLIDERSNGSSDPRIGVDLSSDGTYQSSNKLVGTTTLQTDTPYMAAWTFRGGEFSRLYLDAVLEDEQTSPPSSIYRSAVKTWIGAQFSKDADNCLDGTIAHVLIYDRSLTASEIRALHADPFRLWRPPRTVVPVLAAVPASSTGPSGVTLRQSVEAAFPDRPGSGGTGLEVAMEAGGDGAYVEADLGTAEATLHSRFVLNPGTAAGGSVVLLRGLNTAGDETFRTVLDAAGGALSVDLAGGTTLSGGVLNALPWHGVEIRVDADGGEAVLWIDGRPVDSASGSFEGLATRRLWLGAPLKAAETTGTLHLDEWAIADGYIGPVRVDPSTGEAAASDPARWLVIYNTSHADSVAWAMRYREARGVPFANLLGLNLSSNEEIEESAFLAMRDGVAAYLSDNGLAEHVVGILCGHGVPGAYIRSVDGRAEAIAGQLHRIGDQTTAVSNPLAPLTDADPVLRPTPGNLDGNRLTARIDGPTLEDSVALTDRALTIERDGLVGDPADPGGAATVWLDPYGPDGELHALRQSQMEAWADSLDRQLLRLPLERSAEGHPGYDISFDAIRNDGFFWGWSGTSVAASFFDDPPGKRVFCGQLAFVGATASTLRDASDSGWVIRALQAGYAAAGGSSRAYTGSAVPLVRPFFEALRRGWRLGEAWFVANPWLRVGLMLVGDPLMRVPTPRSGWNVYGPFTSWAEADFTEPMAALRENKRSLVIDPAHRSAEGEEAIYVVRHVDGAGREEAGLRHVLRRRTAEGLVSVPWGPAWPAAPGWSPEASGAGWRIAARWAGRFDRLNVARVQLIEQAQGDAEQVVIDEMVDPTASRIAWDRVPEAEMVRFRLRAVAQDGGAVETHWSRWVRPGSAEPVGLELL